MGTKFSNHFHFLYCPLKDFMMIAVGSFLLSLAIGWLADPAGLVIGGISGLSIVIKSISGGLIPLAVTNLVLNIPLYLISFKQRGFRFIQKSLYAVLLMSLFLWLITLIPNPLNFGDDLLMISLTTGVLSGIGIGMVLRTGGTTGGTEMLAAIIKFRHPHFPISKLIFIIDGVIITLGFFLFGTRETFYAVLCICVCTKLIDSILEGVHFAKEALIISHSTQAISTAIFKEINRGNTSIPIKGMYTKKDQEMLMVVVSKKEIVALQRIVKTIDPGAFMIIGNVHEVLGEGFNEQFDINVLN